MHDLKFIRDNRDLFEKSLKKRNISNLSNKIIQLHDEYLENLNKTQDFREKKNILSKNFSPKMNEQEMSNLKTEVLILKEKIEKYKDLSDKKYEELTNFLLEIPNLVDEKTPTGKNEEDNKIIKIQGRKKKFNFAPKNHLEIGENLTLLDYEKAIKISGSRFSIMKSELALLNRALINFMLDTNTDLFDYTEIKIPELVKSEALIGTGQLPKFGDDLFKTNFNDLWLIPTAEVPLTNLHREDIINKNDLPLRYTSFTNCFRSEAGASGKDTKGLMREHQFGKVELVTIASPDDSSEEFDRMIDCVETILNKLDLNFRLVELCSGDLGFSSSYTVDFEIWMPGQNKFREVSSCSNCKDFQSRRMKMRVKNFENGEIFYPHTLNGSSLAVGRIIVAILENYQQEDGSVVIPTNLRKYMKGLEIVKP